MHKFEDCDCLNWVISAQEAAALWGLSFNAVSDACRRGALRGRQSGRTWLVNVADMLVYQRGRYWPDKIPVALRPAVAAGLARLAETAA